MKTCNRQAISFMAGGFFILGLVCTLPAKARPASKEKSVPSSKAGQVAAQRPSAGIDVSRMTNSESIGFLSKKEVGPWGHIFSDKTERVILVKGDTVYVAMKRAAPNIKPGDLFTVYRQTPDVVGYLISFLGRVLLKEQLKDSGGKQTKKNLYKAKIIENYKGMRVGDPILPFYPISSCVRPTQPDRGKLKKLKGCRDLEECRVPIVSSKGKREIIGQFSVVYLAAGYNYGIRRGNLFEIAKKGGDDAPGTPALPDVIFGRMLILEARPDTATGVVLSTTAEFSKVAFAKIIPWSETEGALSVLPRCAAK
ncbi:MAG: hypothetical protein H8E10_00320 [Desulfobacterales bacterium]|nr:hypothetical protein [Desulfobacterales bacterium]